MSDTITGEHVGGCNDQCAGEVHYLEADPVLHRPILLTPGCHALVSIGDGTSVITREVANRMKSELTALFPGVRFTIINGRIDAVQPAEDVQP